MLLNDSCGGVGEGGETKHPNHCQLLMGTKCSLKTQQKVSGPWGGSSQNPLSSVSPQIALSHLWTHFGASVSEIRFVLQVHLPPLHCPQLGRAVALIATQEMWDGGFGAHSPLPTPFNCETVG